MSRILVVGSLHYDIVVEAPHLPRRDETVMGSDVRFVCGGKGGNQVIAASRHGGEVFFVGAVGKDFFADALLDDLYSAGVDTSGVARIPDIASGMSVAIVEQSGDYRAVVASGANRTIGPKDIRIPDKTRYLLLQNEVSDNVNLAAARQAQDKGTRVILNAAPMRPLPDGLLDCVDILIVNRVEAAAFFGEPADTPEQVATLVGNHGRTVETVIVTLGADGFVFRAGGNAPEAIPAHPVKIISSHGAGDAFVSALSSRLADDAGLEEALAYANAAAVLHVSTVVDEPDDIGPETVADFLRYCN